MNTTPLARQKSANKNQSPKTPGGISKSLLTPCRRVGLSRKWKKVGPAPFISPLANENPSKNTPTKDEVTPKRKRQVLEAETENNLNTPEILEKGISDEDISTVINPSTPKVQLPQRKKSKKLITELESPKVVEPVVSTIQETLKPTEKPTIELESVPQSVINEVEEEIVTKPTRQKSKPLVKEKSPNNLTKECIVVIQKKLLKSTQKPKVKEQEKKLHITSQVLFDSDSDDTPLSTIKNDKKPLGETENLPLKTIPEMIEDDDFAPKPKINSKVKKLQDKNTSTGDLKMKMKTKKTEPKTQISQSSYNDDDEDFDMNCKRTILIRKTYDKVTKPSKSKSTGSISQQDIDDLKARIEMKKNLLLTKAMTKDTEELRSLIKRWRKGCQDALTELLDLMKTKFPDRQNMDYSEILQTLRIPANLIGYDSDNDLFLSQDDSSILLSRFN